VTIFAEKSYFLSGVWVFEAGYRITYTVASPTRV